MTEIWCASGKETASPTKAAPQKAKPDDSSEEDTDKTTKPSSAAVSYARVPHHGPCFEKKQKY